MRSSSGGEEKGAGGTPVGTWKCERGTVGVAREREGRISDGGGVGGTVAPRERCWMHGCFILKIKECARVIDPRTGSVQRILAVKDRTAQVSAAGLQGYLVHMKTPPPRTVPGPKA